MADVDQVPPGDQARRKARELFPASSGADPNTLIENEPGGDPAPNPPQDRDPAQDPADATPIPPAASTDEQQKPFYEGFRKIKDADEMRSYAADLERRLAEATLRPSQQPNQTLGETVSNTPQPGQPSQQVVKDPLDYSYEELGRLMFEDQTQYVQVMEERAKRSRSRDEIVQTRQKKFWDGFYQEYPDLQKCEVLVKSVLDQQGQDMAKLSIEEGKKMLATEARKLAEGIRGTGGRRTELPSGTAHALSATSGAAPQSAAPAAPQVVSFSDQIRKLKASRR